MTILAGTAVFAACQEKEEDLGPARISVSPTELSFEAPESSKSVELTATRDWTVQSSPDWVALSVSSGEASTKAQTISVSVNENKSNNRDGEVIFTIGLSKATLKVSQVGPGGVLDNGDGTLEKPYSVAGVVEYVNSLGSDVQSPNSVYVKGLISTVETTFEGSGTYGNATFNMVDSQGSSVVFKAFQTYYLGNRKWVSGDKEVKTGDEVIVYGPVVNYKGNTPETAGKGASFIYSLNGVSEGGTGGDAGTPEGDGSVDNPYNVAAALAKAKETGETATAETYYIKGIISSVEEQYGTQFGNATFNLVDEGSNASFKAFRIQYFNNKRWTEGGLQVKEGDEAVICGKIVNFRGNTPETEQGSGYLYSLNGEKGSEEPAGTPEGEGTLEKPYNVAAAINAVKDLTWTSTTEYQKVGPYYITGKVSAVNDGYSKNTFGNGTFEIVDEEGGASFKVYRAMYLGNQQWTAALGEDVKVGDVVVVYAELMNYRGNTPETVQNGGYLYSLNGKTAPETPTPTPGEPKGTGTEADPYNPAAANAVAKALSWTAKDDYEKTDPVYVKGKITSIKEAFSAQFGNASFYISEDGDASSETFYAFRVLYFGGEMWKAGDMELKVGDEVVIYAPLMNYHGDTPETVDKQGYIVSINGVTGGETPGPVDPEMAEPAGTGTEEDPFNVAAAIAKAQETGTVATEVEYYITGTVYGTADVSGEHGNATFAIIDKGYPSAPFTLYRIKSFGGAAFTGKESIKAGDEVVVKGQIVNYQDKTPEISYAGSVVLINGKTEFDEVDPGEVPDSDFGSNVTWQLGDAAATQTAVVNGTEDVSILKLGTSKKTGSATLSIPSGSTRISFYAISWNKAVSTVVFKAGGKELGTISPAANSGLQNNPPYSLTVSEGDYYEIELDGATTVTVETSGTNPRAALFGIQAR